MLFAALDAYPVDGNMRDAATAQVSFGGLVAFSGPLTQFMLVQVGSS